MTWQSAVERTVTGLGYDLVGTEKGAGGLLRVYIEHEQQAGTAERWITVDDCERVTRQLQHVLEVENCDYARLEVSSPGLDRPLRRASDYARFVGEQVEIALKLPFQGRKKWRGALRARPGGGDAAWQLLLVDEAAAARGKPGKARPKAPALAEVDRVLDFSLDEVREAHLVPVVNFKGRPSAAPAEEATAPHDEDEGGRIQ